MIPTPSTRIKTLKIDGTDVSAREHDTILEVARENGIAIPTLCAWKGSRTSGPAACASSRSRDQRSCSPPA
jgi:predicted molibdopterin-dependent oxidoreductase YjgC